MALQNSNILVGATTAFSAGTARSVKFLDLASGILSLLVDEGLAYNLRKTIKVSSTEAKALANGAFGPRKGTANIYAPKVLADGTTFINKVTTSYDLHPETTDAEVSVLRGLNAQISADTPSGDWWIRGAKS